MIVTTVNVNGLRAAARKGFTEWLAATSADVVCLQEVRAALADLPDALREPPGWHTVHAASAVRGRAGVAVLSRIEPSAVRVGIDDPGFAAEFGAAGRYLEVDLPGVTVASLYLPTGEAGIERQTAKEWFMAVLLAHLGYRREKAADDDREVVVCGDWNIAHTEADLRAWRANRGKSGFLPDERAWLDRLFGEVGYVDVVRAAHPGVDGPYSWWSYRGRAFDNDTGWRIDYQAATPGLAATVSHTEVERAVTYDTRWSDHAPVTVRYGS